MKIATIQNCQSNPTADYLQKALNKAEVEQFRLDHPSWTDLDAQERFLDGARSADFVFAQPTALPQLSPEALRDRFGEKLVLVTNLHYRGLTPDCCYVGSRASRVPGPLPYHSVVILDSFKRGHSVDECVSRFSFEGFDELGLFSIHSEAIAELKAREEDMPVKSVPLIERFYKTKRLFYTMNHPSIFMISRYMHQILMHIDAKPRRTDVTAMPDRLYHHQVLPIFDFVAERFGLTFRETQLYKQASDFFSLRSIVHSFYESYANEPLERLTLTPFATRRAIDRG
ncbi:WcbI family polysaccharide biosynthesis putative acetyltransferase [Acuticoccus kandeliae]|uniref:WcbI family polysaccharide biosynthesis putative acetyltransferase n=1 Tax=Acuticoccus kandeliae TaxID=2073160 RepID=UPI000D3EC6A0|nr:WcbI family polysaccharide biosynthesis putative acetyltransferase [Acuticoccus kandeliae]